MNSIWIFEPEWLTLQYHEANHVSADFDQREGSYMRTGFKRV